MLQLLTFAKRFIHSFFKSQKKVEKKCVSCKCWQIENEFKICSNMKKEHLQLFSFIVGILIKNISEI